MRGVDQRVDALAQQIIRQSCGAAKTAAANRHRLARGRSGAAGERQRHVKLAAAGQSFRQHARFRRTAENKDCARFFAMPLPEAIEHDTAASPRWLSIVGIGEDGVDGLSATARGLISAAEIVFGGKRHLGLAAPLIRGAARPWPSPFDGAAEEVDQSSRPADLRARFRRSVPLRRRRGVGANDRCARDDRRAGAIGLQPGGGAARLVVGGDDAAFGARPQSRSGSSASAAGRAHSCADIRRRWTARRWRSFSRNRASARRGSPCSKRSADRASAFALRRRPHSISAPSMRSTRWRSRWRPRPMRASSPAAPASPMISSSMTARSPSAKCAR